MNQYPLTGFHFKASFLGLPGEAPVDVKFKNISGLTMSMNTESLGEGGENRFQHKLPTRAVYSDITLKRGFFINTGLYKWCRNAIEHFEFAPLTVLISLLNEEHQPTVSWRVFNAIPTKWEITEFNAESNEIVIESIVLSYSYFTPV